MSAGYIDGKIMLLVNYLTDLCYFAYCRYCLKVKKEQSLFQFDPFMHMPAPALTVCGGVDWSLFIYCARGWYGGRETSA